MLCSRLCRHRREYEAYSIYPIYAYVVQFPVVSQSDGSCRFHPKLADISDKPIISTICLKEMVLASKERLSSLFSQQRSLCEEFIE